MCAREVRGPVGQVGNLSHGCPGRSGRGERNTPWRRLRPSRPGDTLSRCLTLPRAVPMTAFLPHEDPYPRLREKRLNRARKCYQFCHTHVSPLAIAHRVPTRHRFAFVWLVQAAKHVRVVIRNRLLLEGDSRAAVRLEKDYKVLTGILRSRAGYFASALRHFVFEALVFRPRDEHARRPEAIEEYAALFRAVGLPPVAADLDDDRTFAWLRVAGPNPLVLQRVPALDDRFPVTEADFRIALPGDSLAAAGAQGRLYLADYAALAAVES